MGTWVVPTGYAPTRVLPLFVQQMCYKSATHCQVQLLQFLHCHCCNAIVALQLLYCNFCIEICLLTYILHSVTFSENQPVIIVTQNVCVNKSLSETTGWDESRYEEE